VSLGSSEWFRSARGHLSKGIPLSRSTPARTAWIPCTRSLHGFGLPLLPVQPPWKLRGRRGLTLRVFLLKATPQAAGQSARAEASVAQWRLYRGLWTVLVADHWRRGYYRTGTVPEPDEAKSQSETPGAISSVTGTFS